MNTRIFRLLPNDFTENTFALRCECDPGNAEFKPRGRTKELDWRASQVGAHNDEQVVFHLRDTDGHELSAVSVDPTHDSIVNWGRTAGICISPPFVSPLGTQNEDEVAVEVTIVAIARGATPSQAADGTFESGSVQVRKRKIKIVYVPRIGD